MLGLCNPNAVQIDHQVVPMINIFSTILQTVLSIVQFFVNTVASFFRAVQIIFEFVSFGTTAIAYIPSPLVVFISVGITISVIFFLIGR